MLIVWSLLFLLVFVTTPKRGTNNIVLDLIWIGFYYSLFGWAVMWFLATYMV